MWIVDQRRQELSSVRDELRELLDGYPAHRPTAFSFQTGKKPGADRFERHAATPPGEHLGGDRLDALAPMVQRFDDLGAPFRRRREVAQ